MLGSRVKNLLDRLVDLREIILIDLRARGLLLFLRLRRREERRRSRNRCRRWLRKGRWRLGKTGDRSSAEIREVRNRLETIGDGSQIE